MVPYSVWDYVASVGEVVEGFLLTSPTIPLGLGFDVPLSPFDVPYDVPYGGDFPSLASQVRAIIRGQYVEGGLDTRLGRFYLPSPLDRYVRSHTSATLAFLYRNSTGYPRSVSGLALDLIHPGWTSLIDSETPFELHSQVTQHVMAACAGCYD